MLSGLFTPIVGWILSVRELVWVFLVICENNKLKRNIQTSPLIRGDWFFSSLT